MNVETPTTASERRWPKGGLFPALAATLVALASFHSASAQIVTEDQVQTPPATYSALPSEIPEKFEPRSALLEYDRREAEIPMRDGVHLHTVILVPKGSKNAPILLTRTPYNADKLTSYAESSHLEPLLRGYDNASDVIVEGGYIRVVQDIRGKHGSEGDYVMNRRYEAR